MKIDDEFQIWQRKEEPLSIMKVPYQNLQPLILKAAGRFRNRGEWHNGASGKRSRVPLEINNDISRIAHNLAEEEKGILRTVQMGGNQALNKIVDSNQDVGRICSYCHEAISTSDHIKWVCKHFDPIRKEVDAELAGVPHKYFPSCVTNGIAPAMNADG